MGEIYPLGGAGDRLGLVDEATGECLPVAMLPYCSRTLLEGLVRDLQVNREHGRAGSRLGAWGSGVEIRAKGTTMML